MVVACPRDPAIGQHDLYLVEVVDGPSESTREIPQASTQGQAGHTHLRDEAERYRQAMGLRRLVHLVEQAARVHVCQPRYRVDGHLAEQRHVERDPVIHERGARDVVTPAPDGHRKPGPPGKVDRRHDICGASGSHDDARSSLDQAVPDPGRIVESGLAGSQDLPGDPRPPGVEQVRAEHGHGWEPPRSRYVLLDGPLGRL